MPTVPVVTDQALTWRRVYIMPLVTCKGREHTVKMRLGCRPKHQSQRSFMLKAEFLLPSMDFLFCSVLSVSVFLMTQLFGKRETAFTEEHCDSGLLTMK